MNAPESYYKQLFLQEILEHLEYGTMLCDETFRIKFINNKASLFLDIKDDRSSDSDSIDQNGVITFLNSSFKEQVKKYYARHTGGKFSNGYLA